MPQSGYTPILLYGSGTTGNTPSAGNLTSSSAGSELAINYFDGKLFYKDNAGVVQVLATKATGTIGGSTTQVQYNNSGVLAGSADFVFSGTGVGIGGAVATPSRLYVAGTHPSSGAQTQVVRVGGTLSSSTTGSAAAFLSRPVTEAASYTLSDLIHFWANPDTFGAGSTVTSQFGFYADNTITAAKYNYGYYSAIQGKAPLNISSINGNGSTVTVDTASAHGLSNGDQILIARVPIGTMTVGSYNGGPYTITVVDSDTFTFSSVATSSAPVTSGQIVYLDRWAFYGANTASSVFGGNVGVGAFPVNRLDIVQSNSGGSVVLRIANSGGSITNNTSLISFDTINEGVGVRDAQIYAINGGTNNVSLVFATANGSTPAEAMRISPAGNVGIGTSSPSAKLSIDGGNVSLNNATYATYQTVSGTVEGQFAANATGGGTVDVRAVSNHPMLFYTNNTEKMRITSAGNVGIGTTSPQGLLEVSQPSTLGNVLTVRNTSASQYALGGVSLLNGATSNNRGVTIGTAVRDSDGSDSFFQMFSTDVLGAYGGTLSIYDLTDHYWSWYTNNTEKMRITSAGNVGIGTASPSQKLEVVGSAVVSGTMFMSDDQRVQWGTSSSAYIVGKQGGSGTGLVKIGANGDIVYITAAGNVGINNASPAYTLDVTGTINATGNITGGNFSSGITTAGALAITNMTNVASATAGAIYYTRVGDNVVFGGPVTVQATATGAVSFQMALPVASNFSGNNQASGTIVSGNAADMVGVIQSNSTNDTFDIQYTATTTASRTFVINGIYRVI